MIITKAGGEGEKQPTAASLPPLAIIIINIFSSNIRMTAIARSCLDWRTEVVVENFKKRSLRLTQAPVNGRSQKHHQLSTTVVMPLLSEICQIYLRRFAIDHWYRFAKQRLHWTLPKLAGISPCGGLKQSMCLC